MAKVKRREWLQKIGLMAGACLIALVLGEVGLRIAGVSYPVFDIYDEVLGAKLLPGKEGWYRKEGQAYLRINSLGYRDAERALEAQPGTFRIAVLGDSFTEARQMPIEHTYWDRLAKSLETCPALEGQDVEVLNFGIGGYSTTQAILAYNVDARRFQPDLVLLGFFPGNDVRENSRALNKTLGSWLAHKPYHDLVDGELKLSKPAPLPTWKGVIFQGVQHSRLLELLNEARRQWNARKKRADQEARIQAVEAGISADVYYPPDSTKMSDDLADAWRLTERLLSELNQRVLRDGTQFMVATIPTSVQTHPDIDYRNALTVKLGVDDLLFPERQLASFGQNGDYAVFPLVEEMQAAAGDRHFHHR
ncbi:MAG: SGNH/GDSL hydrolase family protein, partial [Alphaproteobacteria bacterium]|nr:SGNH/GDSL hydrolase family protein [Alphaproteobacteria bacterium]